MKTPIILFIVSVLIAILAAWFTNTHHSEIVKMEFREIQPYGKSGI